MAPIKDSAGRVNKFRFILQSCSILLTCDDHKTNAAIAYFEAFRGKAY